MQVKHLDHLNLTVKDFKKTVDWYSRVFDFEMVEEGVRNGHRWGILKAGEALLCIYENPERTFFDGETLEQKNIHGLNHFSFRISDGAKWEARVKQENLVVHFGGAYRYAHSTSWYINDPTGYEIEVVLWDDDKVTF